MPLFYSLPGVARFFIVGASVAALGGCMALPTTNKRVGEALVLTVHERPQPLDLSRIGSQKQLLASRSRGGPVLLLPLLAKALPIAVNSVKGMIKAEQKKYTADYQLGKSNLYFYAAPSPNAMLDPRGIQFQGLEVKRTVREDKEEALAMQLRLDMKEDDASLYNLLNNSVFQLKVASLNLNYTKAKVPAARWYMPWTLIYKKQDQVNLDVVVKFFGSWIGEEGTIRTNQLLGTSLLTMRNVPINDSVALRAYEQKQRGKTLDGYFYLVPRSAGSYMGPATEQGDGIAKGFGQGIYSVSVSVVESGKTHLVNKVIIDNLNVLDTAPSAIMKQLK